MLNGWQKQKLLKRRFTLPNELFSLGLTTAEISIYTYLLFLENRKTHQCWPSYKTIGKAVDLSPKTVKKYVGELVDKGLISTENTTITTKKGVKRNGSLRYIIRPSRRRWNCITSDSSGNWSWAPPDGKRKGARVKRKQDKGVPPQAASLRPQLPAVRAVFGGQK